MSWYSTKGCKSRNVFLFLTSKSRNKFKSKFLYIKKQVQKILKMPFYYSCWWFSFFLCINLTINYSDYSLFILKYSSNLSKAATSWHPCLNIILSEGRRPQFLSGHIQDSVRERIAITILLAITHLLVSYLHIFLVFTDHWQQVKTHNKYLLLSVNKV